MSTHVQQFHSVPPQPRERYVGSKVAAQFLDCSISHLLELTRNGRIPAHPISEGEKRTHWRFLISELDEHMRKHNNASRQPEPSQERV